MRILHALGWFVGGLALAYIAVLGLVIGLAGVVGLMLSDEGGRKVLALLFFGFGALSFFVLIPASPAMGARSIVLLIPRNSAPGHPASWFVAAAVTPVAFFWSAWPLDAALGWVAVGIVWLSIVLVVAGVSRILEPRVGPTTWPDRVALVFRWWGNVFGAIVAARQATRFDGH